MTKHSTVFILSMSFWAASAFAADLTCGAADDSRLCVLPGKEAAVAFVIQNRYLVITPKREVDFPELELSLDRADLASRLGEEALIRDLPEARPTGGGFRLAVPSLTGFHFVFGNEGGRYHFNIESTEAPPRNAGTKK